MIKFIQSTQFINKDLHMYHFETNTPALARTSGLGRAPAVALAYMFWVQGYKLSDACNLLLGKRPCIPKVEAIKSAIADMEKSGGQKATKEKSGGQKATKAQVRITVRQNRSDSKKALKNLLNTYSFQPATSNWAAQQINNKKTQSGSAQRTAKPNKKKTKSRADKWRRESYYEDQYYSERVFETAFGNRWKTWSDNKSSSQRSHEYEWRRYSRHDDESSLLGSYSDRKILGLPLTGPLKIEDVKIAFRVSALKWHPDKHQGPSLEMAEEKFKLCHNAYQSLCKVLGP